MKLTSIRVVIVILLGTNLALLEMLVNDLVELNHFD